MNQATTTTTTPPTPMKTTSRKKTPQEPPKCTICDEIYNKTFRAPVTCLCDFTCCRTCAKQYIQSKVEDAHCMSCRVKWNRDFITQHFEKTYVNNDYRVYRENILFEKEMGLLPMTQPHVEKEIAVENMENDYQELLKEFEQIQKKMSKKRREINEFQSSKDMERRKYVRKCPKNECQGFLSQNLKCEICESWVCSECREIKGTTREAEHTCNPEILETVKFLASDTKPCPKCTSMIHKIEGCAQMFCTECHTAFNWNTLRIETGVVHNPHYFEWLRTRNNNHAQIERNPNDVLCGRELDNVFVTTLRNNFIKMYNLTDTKSNANIKKKIIAILCELFKPQYNTYFESIVRDIDSNTELTRKFNVINPFEYATALIRYISTLLSRNRVLESHRPYDDTAVKECLQKIGELKIVKYEKKIFRIEKIIRNILHISHVELNRWNVRDQITSNLDLRILYMRNKIDPEMFKTQIQRRDKESQRNLELNNVLRTYISCMTDLMYRILEKTKTFVENQQSLKEELDRTLLEIFGKDDQDSILKECNELRLYTNECMKTVFQTYGSKMSHHINNNFEYSIVNFQVNVVI